MAKMITGMGKLSYANIWEKQTSFGGAESKYSTVFLIPKSDAKTLDKIGQAIADATEEGKAKWDGKVPHNLKLPLRDGDLERSDDENYVGHYFFSASSQTKPGILGYDKKPIDNPEEVYSGCYCVLSVNFYPFSVNGNRGIAVGLNNILKIKDGERLSGSLSAEDDFKSVDISDFLDSDSELAEMLG